MFFLIYMFFKKSKNKLEKLLVNVNKDLTKLNIVNKLSYMYKGLK